MKLRIDSIHRSLTISRVDWSSNGELYASTDENCGMHLLDSDVRAAKQLLSLPSVSTDLHVIPPTAMRRSKDPAATELTVAGCLDGSLRTLTKSGRVEKTANGHTGAVTCVRWSRDGTMIASAGEDGIVTIWSRVLAPQASRFHESPAPVLQLCWDASGKTLALVSGRDLYIRSRHSNALTAQVAAAHDGLVLAVDWSAVNDLIVTGGEDTRYKVWTRHGLRLYSSPPLSHAVTCVAWSPSQHVFAVGQYDVLLLCDKQGYVLNKVQAGAGSVLRLSWMWDGGRLAAACANSTLLTGQVVGEVKYWKRIEVTLSQPQELSIYNKASQTVEYEDFNHRILRFNLACDKLLVSTASQCTIINPSTLTNNHTFETPATVVDLVPGYSVFATFDTSNNLHVYNYEGALLSSPKPPGQYHDNFSGTCLALADDVLACIDPSDPKNVHFFDPMTAKSTFNPLKHSVPLQQLFITGHNRCTVADRLLVALDSHQELWVWRIAVPGAPVRLSALVHSVKLHDHEDMIAAVVDGALRVWYLPLLAFLDPELLTDCQSTTHLTLSAEDQASVQQFCGWRVTLSVSKGSKLVIGVPPYCLLALRMATAGHWPEAVRLCRAAKEPVAWACLAGLALRALQLEVAVSAYTALDQLPKVQFLRKALAAVGATGAAAGAVRAAKLALLRGDVDEAEKVYTRAGCHYYALKVNATAFRWDRVQALAANSSDLAPVAALLRSQVEGVAPESLTGPWRAMLTDPAAAAEKKLQFKQQERKVLGLLQA